MHDVRTLLHDLVEAGAADVLRELRAAIADAECAISVRAQAARLESPDNRYAVEVHQLRCLAGVYVAEMDARLERATTLRGTSPEAVALALAEGTATAGAGAPSAVDINPAPRPIHIAAQYMTLALCGAVQAIDQALVDAISTPTCPACIARAASGWLPDVETCERWLAEAQR